MKIKRNGKKKRFKFGWKDLFLYGFLFLFLLFLTIGLGDFSSVTQQDQSVSLSQVINDAKADKVKEIVVSDTKMDIVYKDGKKVTTKKSSGKTKKSIYKPETYGISFDSLTFLLFSVFVLVVAVWLVAIMVGIRMFYFLSLINFIDKKIKYSHTKIDEKFIGVSA